METPEGNKSYFTAQRVALLGGVILAILAANGAFFTFVAPALLAMPAGTYFVGGLMTLITAAGIGIGAALLKPEEPEYVPAPRRPRVRTDFSDEGDIENR